MSRIPVLVALFAMAIAAGASEGLAAKATVCTITVNSASRTYLQTSQLLLP
jgi:hypothetical protein